MTDYFLIKSKLNGFGITIADSKTAPRTPIISFPINNVTGTDNQLWELVPIPPSIEPI
jgi:hypothetical protein